jgi:hypothetical protein
VVAGRAADVCFVAGELTGARPAWPASAWIKGGRLHTLIPRGTERWKSLFHQRVSVEREFGRLKNEWAMLPLRVRRIYRVRLHVDLTILAQLAFAPLKTRT